jgi:rfaE bifunctional protein kinase chain/domain
MNPPRFQAIIRKYRKLRIAVVGDFCLDRYLEIDPAKGESSIETGLPVHNIVNIRSQPGGAGTIVNNLVALGVGEIFPVGFAGEDGEGFELTRSLRALGKVKAEAFFTTAGRRTFTYIKPLVVSAGKAPRELNRLDVKNWSATPEAVQRKIVGAVLKLAAKVDAMVLMDQADKAETGVVTSRVLEAIRAIRRQRPELIIVADSRRGLKDFPKVCLKMNRAELRALAGAAKTSSLGEIKAAALALAGRQGKNCFVTLAGKGMLGASPEGELVHLPALPLRGPIDIVGAGDSVTANLTAALAAGGGLREALEIANAAASVVIHKLGTTGTASIAEISGLTGL